MLLTLLLAVLLITSAAYLVHQFLSRELGPDIEAPARDETPLQRRKAA